MPVLFYALDSAAIFASLAAAVRWYQAGARSVRRISAFVVLDVADINRIVVAMNRSAILNLRAALASALGSICISLRFAASIAASAV